MRYVLFVVAAAAFASSSLSAGVLKVEINGTTYTVANPTPVSPPLGATVSFSAGSTPDITIGFPNQVTTSVTIRIFDDATVGGSTSPTLSVGKLRINGTASRAARVNLVIADGDQGFPPTPTAAEALSPGLANFGGTSGGVPSDVFWGQSHDFDEHPNADVTNVGNLPSGSSFIGFDTDLNPSNGYQVDSTLKGLIIPDPSLRRQTVLAVAVTNDICPGYTPIDDKTGASQYIAGRIEAGQIVRLAAFGVAQPSGSIVGGNINAYIVADSMDSYLSYNICNPAPGFTGFHAIESITAGNAIHGSITAFGRTRDDIARSGTTAQGRLFERTPTDLANLAEPGTFPSCSPATYPLWVDRGSIFNVRLGPSVNAEGIYGDIVSTNGRIYSVRSTGEIVASQITAADGVLEVRIHKWGEASDANKTPLGKNLNVSSISASTGFSVQKVGSDPGDDYAATIAKARNQGCINLIETKGEFYGTVICDNMIDAGNDSKRDSLKRSGIIIWDNLQIRTFSVAGPTVTVRHLAHNVCMLAPSFNQINVGWQFKGTIDAFGSKSAADPETEPVTEDDLDNILSQQLTCGSVGGLFIGTDAALGDAVTRDVYHGMVPGFVGGFRPPVDLNPHSSGGSIDPTMPPYIFDPKIPNAGFVNAAGVHAQVGGEPIIHHIHRLLWDPDRYLWVQPVGGAGHPEEYALDEGSLDSVIRAENVIATKSQLFAMHQRIFEDGEPKHAVTAWYRPRMEAPIVEEVWIPNDTGLLADAAFYRYAGIFEGVIWSGQVEYLPFSPFTVWDWHGSIHDYYPTLTHRARVQRIGPGGDVWGKNLGLSVVRDMCGELHATSIAEGSDEGASPSIGVQIGSRLGDLATWPYPSYQNRSSDTSPPALEYTPRDRSRIGPSEYEADIAPLGAVYVGQFHHQVADPLPAPQPTYGDVRRLEQTAGVLVNTGYVSDHGNPLSLWDPLDPASPIYSDFNAAWTGFVRVGDPWVESSRVHTLGKSGAIGTTPLPNATLDVMDLSGHINQYQRHSWELSGLLDREGYRLGGAVGVAPYFLHPEDTSPPLDNPAAPTLPVSYHQLPVWQWVHNWPAQTIVGGTPDPVWGYDGLPRVRFRFYGPVKDMYPALNSDVPVRIERWNGVTSTWVWMNPASSSYFFDYDLVGHGVAGVAYDLYLGPKCNTPVINGIYRVSLHPQITPEGETAPNNRLQCWAFGAGDLGYEPQPFTWYIRLYSDCPDVGVSGGTVGSDGMLDNNDYIAFISLYFAQNPRADFGMAGGLPGSDGVFDNNDFIAFINAFFSGQADAEWLAQHCETIHTCTPPEPGMAPRGGPGNESMGQSGEGSSPTTIDDVRALLQQMIESETDSTRRGQLQEMLNSLPPSP